MSRGIETPPAASSRPASASAGASSPSAKESGSNAPLFIVGLRDFSIIGAGAGVAIDADEGAGASARGAWASVVSERGTAEISSPVSLTTGRRGMTGVPSVAWNAMGAPATSESETSRQSSPETFWTIPHAWSVGPSFASTSRYEGRQSGCSVT